MSVSKNYNPIEIEDKWYKYWNENGFFKSTPDNREPYTIVIPPPNVTGVLHMGHILNNTIQDVLIRKARMEGKNACWVPGTDHASIATEAKVVNKLKEQGIDKNNLSRDEFLKHAWDWTNKHGGIILEQLKKLGASCDWSRTKFTMDDDMSESVIDVFIDLYNKGYIYRGVRMVNWDTKALTAVSDEEVIYKEVKSKLYYIKYAIKNENNNFIIIATTRPETILGDTAICVNPNDERYKSLIGKKAIIPLINREIPIICDEYVDMEFGTGALKITPAHDINDYEIGIKHNLESIDIFNDNGTLSSKAILFVGEDRFVVRNKIEQELQNNNNLHKVEDYINKVGFSERTDVPIEPKLSMQWFMKMDKLSKPALDAVLNDEIKFYPEKIKNTYKHWMENIKDWCISRQLWWGHRIPAYFYGNGQYVVAKSIEEALELAKAKSGADLKIEDIYQDEDVLDTWFSSWLWPLSVFDGIRNPDNKEINYYYPTNDLVTAPEILFFWVARMVIAGYEYKNVKPFTNVYFTGIVRDKQRRKMSKSLGNSPDPIDLMNIFGADGVRMGMLLCSPAGNDLLYDDSYCEQGRNFCNKLWNSFRLINGWSIDENLIQPNENKVAIEWFENLLNNTLESIEDNYEKYRLSDVLMSAYNLVWEHYCSWFLEIIKPQYQQPIDKKTYDSAIVIYEKLLKILHPFMPFITEELWQQINERKPNECITISNMPKSEKYDNSIIEKFNSAKEIVIALRNIRKEKNISFKEEIELKIKSERNEVEKEYFDIISKLCNVSKIEIVNEKVDNSISFILASNEYYVPFGENINKEEEIEKLKKELEYTEGFLNIVIKKLSNDKFVNSAPESVVDIEKKKKQDAEEKIKILKTQIENLKN